MEDRSARYINIALGLWLVISAFVWHHAKGPMLITVITGVAIAVVAISALRAPQRRFLNVALGIWLVISAFVSGEMPGTMWNSVLVGVVVAFVALVGPGITSPRLPARATH